MTSPDEQLLGLSWPWFSGSGQRRNVETGYKGGLVLPPAHIESVMAFWTAEDRTHSQGSDMDTDSLNDSDSLDRDPSPYSDDESGPLWVETPLIRSPHISARLGLNVYLKLEVI